MLEAHTKEIPVEIVVFGMTPEAKESFNADLTIKYYTSDEDGSPRLQDIRLMKLKIPPKDVIRFWSQIGEPLNQAAEICSAPECHHGRFYHFEESGVCEVTGCTCISYVKPEKHELVINLDLPVSPLNPPKNTAFLNKMFDEGQMQAWVEGLPEE